MHIALCPQFYNNSYVTEYEFDSNNATRIKFVIFLILIENEQVKRLFIKF